MVSLCLFLALAWAHLAHGDGERPSAEFPFEKAFIDTADARIAYVDIGDPEDKPILFLHGIPTSSYLWRNVLPGVANSGRRLVAVDLVGFGDSSGTGYGVLDQVRHLEALIDSLGVSDLTLVTHDWGAGIGIMLAQRNPGLVTAFATMEGALPPVYPRADIESFGPAAPLFARMRDPQTREDTVLIQNVWLETILPNSVVEPLTSETDAAYRQPFPTPESRRPILDMVLSLPIAGEPADVVAAYEAAAEWWRGTPIPKLVLYATPGRLQPQRLATWAEENLSNVTTAEVGPGVHFIQEDSPKGIVRELDAWLIDFEKNRRAAQNQTFPINLDNLDYQANPLYKGVESAVVFGDRRTAGLYTTHARIAHGARIPPHTHPNTLTTWVTSGTAFVGTGETFDEDALEAYPAGTFFVTPAGSPHFIAALDGDFSILDHGAGPTAFQLVGED